MFSESINRMLTESIIVFDREEHNRIAAGSLIDENIVDEHRNSIANESKTLPISNEPGIIKSFLLRGGIASLGEYYTFVYMYGQKLKLQVDTGSASLIVAGESCQNCTSRSLLKWNEQDAIPCDGKICYQCFPGSSKCGFRLRYGDDSPQYNLEASGVVVRTSIALEKNGPFTNPVDVYVIQKEIGSWPKKVDGILGMAFERLNCNPTCLPVAWRALAPPMQTQGFMICFGDKSGIVRFYSKEYKRNPKAKYVKLQIIGDPRMYYAVHSRGLAIAEGAQSQKFLLFKYIPSEDLASRSIGIVDSGTTLLIIPDSMWNSLVSYFQEKYCHLDGVCGSPSIFDRPSANQAVCLTHSPYETFPTLGLVVGGAVLRLPPSLYFIQYKKNIYCLGIQPGPIMVIGDAVLRGFTVYYEPDAVIFSSDRSELCGAVEGLDEAEIASLVDRSAHIGYVHHDFAAYGILKRLSSLAILLFVLYVMVHAWRRYMRRRLGYTEI